MGEPGWPSGSVYATGILDVGEWQAAVDIKTGLALAGSREDEEALSDLLRRKPFPGDLSPSSASWVTDVALELDRAYAPPLMVLVHASLSFKMMYGGGEAFAAELRKVRGEIERFAAESGREYAVLGLGNLVRVKGFVNLCGLDGLALGSGFPSSYAGVFRPSARDLERLEGTPGVARVTSREEFRDSFGGSDVFYGRFPDRFLELEEGYTLKAFGIPAREPARMPGKDGTLPLAGDIPLHDRPLSIVDLKDGILRGAGAGKRQALILVEGLGTETFPWSYRDVDNTIGWFRYPLGDAQYMAVMSGKHMVEHGHPPCLRYYLEDDLYPYSGIFNQLPSGLLGQDAPGLSAAVGNRSIYTHACLGADVTVECFARTLYNYGTLAVVRRNPAV